MNDMGVIVNSHTVRIERLLPGPIDRAWEYFTKPEYVAAWLMECTLEPKLHGTDFAEERANPRRHHCKRSS